MVCTACYRLVAMRSMVYHWRQKHRGMPYQQIQGATVDPAETTVQATLANSKYATPTNTTAPNATATYATAPYAAASKTARTVGTADDDGGEGFEQGFGDSGVEEGLSDGLGGTLEDDSGEPMSMLGSNNEDCGLSSKIRADVLITSTCRHDTYPNAGNPKVFLIT